MIMLVDSTTLIGMLFFLFLFLIGILAFLFRRRIREYDSRMRGWFQTMTHLQHMQQGNENFMFSYPMCSYSIKHMTPESHVLQETSFMCVGQSLEEASEKIVFLRDLSLGVYDVNGTDKKDK